MGNAEKILNKTKENLNSMYLLNSEESYLRDEFIDNFIDNFVDENIRDFNLTFLDDEKDSFVDKLINAVTTLPVMANKRYVIAKTAEYFIKKSTRDERLIKLIKNIPETTILLIVPEGKIDKRIKINKVIKNRGRIVELKPPAYRELDEWIRNKFNEEGKKIDSEGIKLLEKMFNNKLQRLNSEIKKIITFCSEKKLIDYEDIKKVISKDRLLKDNVVFDFIDALGEKNTARALKILNEMIEVGEIPFKILGNIIWQLKLLLQVKALKKCGQKPGKIASTLSQHPYPVKKTYKKCVNFEEKELELILERFLQANLEMTTGKYKDAKIPLEMAIMDI